MILGMPALTVLNALIPAGPNPVTIQPEGMARFALKAWRKAGLAMGQVTSAALFIEDEVPDYLLPLCKLMVSAMSLGECWEFNPYVEFAQLFRQPHPRVATPQNHQPRNLPETRCYMGTQMATLTLQILS